MDIIVSKKKIVTYAIIAITILICLVGGATYAYFQADVTATNTVTVNANTASGSYSFTSYADGDLSLELTAGVMANSSTYVSNSIDVVNDTKNLFVNLTAPEDTTVKCTYNVTWTWKDGSDMYETASTGVLTTERPKQYTVDVSKDAASAGTETSVLEETDLSNLTWTSHKAILYAGTIKATDGGTVIDRYEVTSKMYNLDIEQPDIRNKSFRATITVEDINCRFVTALEPVSFANDSWETIQAAVQDGNTSKYEVGNTKCITLNSSVDTSLNSYKNSSCGCATNYYCIRLVNKTSCESTGMTGSNKSQTACGFVIQFEDIITKHRMNANQTNSGGWPASEMRTYVNETIYNALPNDLQSSIISTYVVSSYGNGDTSGTISEDNGYYLYNFASNDKLYLFSPTELWGGVQDADTTARMTRQLDYYSQNNVTTSGSYSAYLSKNFEGTSTEYFLRAAYYRTTYSFFIAASNGQISYTPAKYTTVGVLPAFRIG